MSMKRNMINAQGGNIIAAQAFSRNQAVFNEKARQYASQGVITTPGFLRLESTAPNSGVSSINFNTLDTSGVKTATERRLKLSDTFTITDFSFYIAKVAATSQVSSPEDYSKQTLHTFPNPIVFSTKSDELEVLYNSFLTLRIDTTTFLDSIPLRQFYRVGTSQQGVLGGTGGVIVQADEWPLSMYGKTQLLPTIELNGQSNIEFSIQLPNATNLGGVSTSVNNNLVIILQGFLNQGGATVQRQVQKRLR